jgi:hypothetical protein
MRPTLLLLALGALCSACYQRQDPLVRAAQDLQRMADQFALQEDDKIQQFNSLRLGMSEDDVRKRLGTPASQQAVSTDNDESRELWTYRGALRPLGTLTFVNKRLVEIHAE